MFKTEDLALHSKAADTLEAAGKKLFLLRLCWDKPV